ncbi:hypothetical protein ACFZB2_02910 [Streptomyces bobili]|uniref:hypothetical protein n=1 Tax=Streptomyces bobili TaxID=67280 RepID=UPI0036E66817
MILEDYPVDPELAEPGDLDDAGLQTAVRAAREGVSRRAGDSPEDWGENRCASMSVSSTEQDG